MTVNNERIETFTIFWMIVSSGFVVLNYIFMLPCMMVLLVLALLYLRTNKTISKENGFVLLGILVFTAITEFYTLVFVRKYPFVMNSLIILIIRVFCLAVIQSNITAESFKRKYVDIITGICMVSLVCYVMVNVMGLSLPFTGTYGDSNYYGTFYYQVKFGSIMEVRNSGPYGEAGMFAIAIILALAFLLLSENYNNEKGYITKIIILVITLLSTQSGTGMVCFAILLFVFICKDGFSLSTLKNPLMLLVVIFMVVGFYYAESTYGIIEYKVINQGGSYSTRMEDTLKGYEIAAENFFTGTGICNDYTEAWIGKTTESRSNGLANLAASTGYLFLAFYIARLIKQCHIYMNNRFVYTFALVCILICVYNTQPVVMQTIGLSYLFAWKKEYEEVDLSLERSKQNDNV